VARPQGDADTGAVWTRVSGRTPRTQPHPLRPGAGLGRAEPAACRGQKRAGERREPQQGGGRWGAPERI